MEFSEEFVKENGLTEEQVTKITEHVSTHIAEQKKEWDGKASKDAEGIIEGAASKLEKTTGIKRENGQKIADYLTFAVEKHFEGTKASLERKQLELEKKLKEGTGDEGLKKELTEIKTQLDKYKQKDALYAEYEEHDYKQKYLDAEEKLNKQQEKLAFSGVKPTFDKSVNKYEANAKWAEFVKQTKESYELKTDENDETWAIDKENEHKRVKLSELVKKDVTLQELLKGKSGSGFKTDPSKTQKIEGVPFEVKANATSAERQEAIKDYLTTVLKLSYTDSEYSKKFAEFNKKIIEGKTP